MNCQTFQENFAACYDGSLPPAKAVQIRRHIAGCIACQEEWSALREFRARRALTELRNLYIQVQKEKIA